MACGCAAHARSGVGAEEAVITRAAMYESQRNAWCRENSVYLSELEQWESAVAALNKTTEERAGPQ